MNRNLLIFSLILILIGLAFNLYLISFFGLIFLFPAALASSKPPRPVPTSRPEPPPRRIIPKPAVAPAPTASPAEPMTAGPSTTPAPYSMQPYSTQSYTPALFPSPLLSPLGPMASPPVAALREPPGAKHEVERDELVEVGTILAVLKIFLG